MTTKHAQLLDERITIDLPNARALAGRCFYITGASGFLAASLIAYLHRLRELAGVNFAICASARRPMSEVPLFRFLGITPSVEWAIDSAENCILPDSHRVNVLHTASYGAPNDYLREPMSTYTANADGLLNLYRQHERIEHFIYFSSAEIYGQPDDAHIPTAETYVGGLPTLSIRSIYGESKRIAEVLGACLGAQHKIPFTALRPWNIYGPGQRLMDGRVPMEFIRQALAFGKITLASNGKPTRALCHVWDGVSQIVATLRPTGECVAYNIGNGEMEISMLDLARECATAAGLTSEAVHYNAAAPSVGLQRCAPDVARVSALLGRTRSAISLSAGLETLVEWNRFLS
jgi:UDP-glucuronate decarboxylase